MDSPCLLFTSYIFLKRNVANSLHRLELGQVKQDEIVSLCHLERLHFGKNEKFLGVRSDLLILLSLWSILSMIFSKCLLMLVLFQFLRVQYEQGGHTESILKFTYSLFFFLLGPDLPSICPLLLSQELFSPGHNCSLGYSQVQEQQGHQN